MVGWAVCLPVGKWRKWEWVKALVTRMEKAMVVVELPEPEQEVKSQPYREMQDRCQFGCFIAYAVLVIAMYLGGCVVDSEPSAGCGREEYRISVQYSRDSFERYAVLLSEQVRSG
jgi:hypothetical protein